MAIEKCSQCRAGTTLPVYDHDVPVCIHPKSRTIWGPLHHKELDTLHGKPRWCPMADDEVDKLRRPDGERD